VQRAIPSVLAGGYPEIELLVCSDGPQPHARAAVEAIQDPRVRYIELDERPVYPKRRQAFWQTAGTYAVNRLVEEARGEYIAPLDHDDAFTADHIPLLLSALRQSGADFAYGQAMTEQSTGAWGLLGSSPLSHGHIVHASVLYSRRLAHMRYDADAWLLDEPGDWNLWRRMREAGAEITHLPMPVAVHFKEGSSIADREDEPERTLEAAAEDVLATPARRMLEIASAARGVLDGAGAPERAPVPRPRGAANGARRLAILDTDLPLWLSGFRYHEFSELLALAPDTVFFSANRTGEDWPRPVYPLGEFAELAPELGVTDAYAVFLNFTVSLLGLQRHPGAASCGGIPPDFGVAGALRDHGIRLHATLYPGGGLVTDTDPELLRAVADRCATVFTNTAEVVDAVPQAVRIAGPMATEFYAFRERERRDTFHVVFAADDRPRKGLDTALAALELLDERFHLHVVGPHERYLHGIPADRVTAHGFLKPAELRGVYWGCDAFVSPVRIEGPGGRPGEIGLVDGFPTSTACDALSSGCALVTSNPRDEHWIVRPDEHYLEFPVQDHQALAAALQRLEADRDLRDALARRGSARIHEVMNVGRVAAAKLQAMGREPVP
jgi:glycosyltransferase involved in cell wall biosynthesis